MRKVHTNGLFIEQINTDIPEICPAQWYYTTTTYTIDDCQTTRSSAIILWCQFLLLVVVSLLSVAGRVGDSGIGLQTVISEQRRQL